MIKNKFIFSAICLLVIGFVSATSADFVEFNFVGNAGNGLLPDNEVGMGTAFGSGSPAIGDEAGVGVVLDPDTNLLIVSFQFQDLTDGLFFDAVSGIHLHEVTDPSDPFNSTGPIVFNLNSFSDANVSNFTPQIADGATSGKVTAVVDVNGFEDSLLAGNFYLNIHSQAFNGGELRANLVAIPEPSAMVIAVGACLLTLKRRRR